MHGSLTINQLKDDKSILEMETAMINTHVLNTNHGILLRTSDLLGKNVQWHCKDEITGDYILINEDKVFEAAYQKYGHHLYKYRIGSYDISKLPQGALV